MSVSADGRGRGPASVVPVSAAARRTCAAGVERRPRALVAEAATVVEDRRPAGAQRRGAGHVGAAAAGRGGSGGHGQRLALTEDFVRMKRERERSTSGPATRWHE